MDNLVYGGGTKLIYPFAWVDQRKKQEYKAEQMYP